MRHKYDSRGIVLTRSSVGEANASVMLLTSDIGLIRARAQGLRLSGAKLANALVTLAESDITLIRGKENWRVVGAILSESWSRRISTSEARTRAGRVSSLLLRLVAGEVHDPKLFFIIKGFFDALATLPEGVHEDAEVLAALRILATLGLDTGKIPGDVSVFTMPILSSISTKRMSYIARINSGIIASGL